MKLKLRYFFYGVIGVVVFVLFVIVFMAVFRLCPPIEAGPKPPWCVNPGRFERDFSSTSLGGALRVKLMELLPYSQQKKSYYDSPKDNINYSDKPEEGRDYSIMFGVAPNDFFWPVCVSFNNCIDPRKNVASTLSRINSIGSDFVVFTDYARIRTDKKIYEDKTALSKKEIKLKIDSAKQENFKTMLLINLFLDDVSVRHTESGDELSDGRVFEKAQQMIALSGWSPNEEEMNLLFDGWEKIAVEKTKKWADVDYIVINPEDLHFHFISNIDLMNKRNKELIKIARENYNGKICVHFKDLNYLKKFSSLDFYKDADCVIFGGHLSYNDFVLENSVESFEAFFTNYFSDDFFKEDNDVEVFQMISVMSYDKYLEDSWFEIWDYYVLALDYEADFRLQANAYEGFFRAIQNAQPNIKGIFHYGYWWEDVDFEDDSLNVKFINSIRNKDAEHIFYRWSRVL